MVLVLTHPIISGVFERAAVEDTQLYDEEIYYAYP